MLAHSYLFGNSPRAHMDLFTFSRPKGLKVVSIVEIYAEFKNPFLKKIPTELFPQIELKEDHPLTKMCIKRKTP